MVVAFHAVILKLWDFIILFFVLVLQIHLIGCDLLVHMSVGIICEGK